jgi:hypothetical protein
MDGIAASQERSSRSPSPKKQSPSPKRLQYGGTGSSTTPPSARSRAAQAVGASRASGATALVPRGGVARWASGPVAISPDGMTPSGKSATAAATDVDTGAAGRKENSGSGLTLPPDLPAAPTPSKSPALLPPPSAPATIRPGDETEDPAVRPEPSDGDAPPISVGDCGLLLRGAALRSEPSLNSPPIGQLVPAKSRVRILEVARCWRFPLPGHPVWRVRVGLIDGSASADANGADADREETIPESLGWISMQTEGGDNILCNESRQQQSDQQEATSTSTTQPAQQQVTPQPSAMHATTNGNRGIEPNHTQQRVAARMARIDRLAEQKEAEYEWTQVEHQSGKSYWCATADYIEHSYAWGLSLLVVLVLPIAGHLTPLPHFSIDAMPLLWHVVL